MKQGAWYLIAVLLLPSLAFGWQEPVHWNEVGSVKLWQDRDARFYRANRSTLFENSSQFNIDQAKEYDKTREYDSTLVPMTLEEFEVLSEDEQAVRIKEASKQLRFLVDFGMRIDRYVQETRQNMSSGWGLTVRDVTVMGDCLRRLGTATGLDPSNPYTWNLLAYFATCVGDLDRANVAYDMVEIILADVPRGELQDMRLREILDRAWIYRDLGRFDKLAEYIQMASQLGPFDHIVKVEILLLDGLRAAQTGELEIALSRANEIGALEIKRFPYDMRTSAWVAELSDVNAWPKVTSDYVRNWIKTMAWLQQGELDMARAAFRKYSDVHIYPFGQQFMNDTAVIYSMLGPVDEATDFWFMARTWTPYAPYQVYKPYGLKLNLLMDNNEIQPYYMGFDLFFQGGSRLAYAADLAARMASAGDDLETQTFALRALDQADIVQRFGIQAGQASVLKAHIYFMLKDYDASIIQLKHAYEYYKMIGDKARTEGIQADLVIVQKNKGDGLAEVFGQSGMSQGRWAATPDPAATREDLEQAYQETPNDDTRRDLARHLIRHDEAEEGRRLALKLAEGETETFEQLDAMNDIDLELALEADRNLDQSGLAFYLVRRLGENRADQWPNVAMWTLAGFICLDAGDKDSGGRALEHALELDPGNRGLQNQLKLMSMSLE